MIKPSLTNVVTIGLVSLSVFFIMGAAKSAHRKNKAVSKPQ